MTLAAVLAVPAVHLHHPVNPKEEKVGRLSKKQFSLPLAPRMFQSIEEGEADEICWRETRLMSFLIKTFLFPPHNTSLSCSRGILQINLAFLTFVTPQKYFIFY